MRPGFEDRLPKYLNKDGVPIKYHKAVLSDFPKKVIDECTNSGLFIVGPIGCGKTHLAVALMVDDIINNIPNRQFITMTNLLSRIKSTYNPNSEESELQILELYSKIPNLFLDDVGVEKVSDWVLNVVYQIIDYRYSNELRTVITSNLTLNLLNDRLGERITSRIKGMCKVIALNGKDRR